MKLHIKKGATSKIFEIFIADSSSTTGAGLTGLLFNSAGLTAYYHRDTDTTATAITLATMTVGTFTSGGFKEIDATNMPGWYQFCPPNAALASGADSVSFHLKGATNMAPLPIEVQLVAYDPQSATNLGLSNLDATVSTRSTYAGADTAGTTTLLTRIPSALTITTGKVDVNDKTGFSLSAAGIQAVWDALTSALTTVGSIGKRIADNLDATISSRSTYAGGAVASVTGNVGGNVVGSVGSVIAGVTVTTNNDKTGYTASTVSDKTGYALTAGEHTNIVADVNTALDAAGTELTTVPTTTGTLRQKINFLFQYFRNKKTQTSTTETLFKEDAATTLGTATLSDDGTTATKGEMN